MSINKLVADIGGTYIRLAVVTTPDQPLQNVRKYVCRDFPDVESVIFHYMSDENISECPKIVYLAVAGPVLGKVVPLTNGIWTMDTDRIRERLNADLVKIINDFTALAACIPHLKDDEKLQIGGGNPIEKAPIGLLGPGTGFGVSGLVMSGGKYAPLAGEGGHIGFAPMNDREIEILRTLQLRFGRVCVERILSGMGIENLYHALAKIDGKRVDEIGVSEIVARGRDNTCDLCREVLIIFCNILGSVCGDLAMTLGAKGGIYIGGGIIGHMQKFFMTSGFRSRFESKGRMTKFVRDIPTYYITADYPALVGACGLKE